MPTKRQAPAVSPRSGQLAAVPESVQKAELRRIPITQIDVPPDRIRRELGAIEDLAYSVGSVGLLHPVQVYRVRTRYRLIAGERRLQAGRMLGWTEIEAMVREPSDNHLLLELIENTQRKWLTDVEEADALIRLVREMGREAKEVAAQAGRSEPYVSKRIRVFEDACLRRAVEQEQLSVSVAEEFLAVAADERPPLVAQAIEAGWDGRRAREAARSRLETAPSARPDLSADRSAAAETLLTLMDETLDGLDVVDAPELRRATSAVEPTRHPTHLAQQVRALNAVLSNVRPFELAATDERALAQLLQTMLRLARAHAGAGRSGIVFPSLDEAQRKVRRR